MSGTNFSGNKDFMKLYCSRDKTYPLIFDNYNNNSFEFKLPLTYDPLTGVERLDTVSIKLEKEGVPFFAIKNINNAIRGIIAPIEHSDYDKPDLCITIDNNGNILFGLRKGENFDGIYKYSLDNKKYVPVLNLATQFTGLKVGPDGVVFAAGAGYILSFNGQDVKKYDKVKAVSTAADFDFDKNLNIWVVTKSAKKITLLTRESNYQTVQDFSISDSYVQEMRSCKYIELNGKNYLYVGGADKDKVEKVVRFEINNGVLNTTPEVMFSNNEEGSKLVRVNSIVLSKKGDIFIGSTVSVPLVWVKTDGSVESMLQFNPSTNKCAIDPNILAMASYGKYIYLVRVPKSSKNKQTIFKVYTGLDMAPYYGRGDN